jgi:hypothetical protein
MLETMPMTARSIRFPTDVWRAVELTAQLDGVSAAQIVRVGTLSYVAFMAGRRNDDAMLALLGLFEAARAAVDAWPL